MRFWIAAVLAFIAFPTFGEVKPETPKPAVVEIVDSVTGYMVDSVTAAVKKAKDDKAPSLLVKIDSPGGSVIAGLRIIAILQSAGLPTVCEADGVAASMAAVILESAACGRRIVKSHTIIMFHGVSVGGDSVSDPRTADFNVNSGSNITAPGAEDLHYFLRTLNRSIAVLIAKRLNMTPDAYLSKTEGKSWWLVGLDAPEQNVADEVRELEIVKAP